jgi:TetR/AcrR family transcriptional repressor of nem operon
MYPLKELSPSALRIVDAAQGLIQEVGYNGFSFEHISQAVGMRKASVHHHFASKADLGVAVVQRYSHQFEASLQQIVVALKTAPERLRAYADLFDKASHNSKYICVCGMLGAETNSLDPAVNAEVQGFFQLNLVWLREVIQEGLSSRTLRSAHEASELAASYLSLLEGAMLVGRSVPTAMGPRRMGDMFLAGLA